MVRVREAPKIGTKVIKKEDYPQKMWDKMGLWPYPKPYNQSSYCNTECRVNEAELKLFAALGKDPNRINDKTKQIALQAIQFATKINK